MKHHYSSWDKVLGILDVFFFLAFPFLTLPDKMKKQILLTKFMQGINQNKHKIFTRSDEVCLWYFYLLVGHCFAIHLLLYAHAHKHQTITPNTNSQRRLDDTYNIMCVIAGEQQTHNISQCQWMNPMSSSSVNERIINAFTAFGGLHNRNWT